MGAEGHKTFKPKDIEEPVDYYVHRPLARLAVSALAPTRVRPNHVSYAAATVGMAAGIIIGLSFRGGTATVPFGGGLLLLSIVLDCADGQLARLRGEQSLLGRALDGFMDYFTPLSVFLGFACLLWGRDYGVVYVLGIGFAAGLSMMWHTQQYDHAKNLYLRNTNPDLDIGGSAMPSYDEIEAERQEYVAAGQRFNAFLMSIFMSYTKLQRRSLDTRDDIRWTTTAEECAIYRRVYRLHMRLWSWLGLGTHLALMVILAFITPFFETAVLYVWAIMYAPMNLLILWLLASRGRLEREFKRQLTDDSMAPAEATPA